MSRIQYPVSGKVPVSAEEAAIKRRVAKVIADEFKSTHGDVYDSLIGELNNRWRISDFDESVQLYQVHYDHPNNSWNFPVYGENSLLSHLKGVIVDLANSRIVCRSQGHTPEVIVDEISKTKFAYQDIYGYKYNEDIKNVRFYCGYDGVIIRVFKHDNVVYYSTHSCMYASNTFWEGKKPFLEVFRELGAPTDEELFPESCTDSAYNYVFMVESPDTQIASQRNVGKGRIYFISHVTNFEEGDVANNDGRKYHFQPETLTWNNVTTSYDISVAEANRYLRGKRDDNIKDRRICGGEFVIAYVLDDEQGQVKYSLRIATKAYSWRLGLRRDGLVKYSRFLELARYAQQERGKSNTDFQKEYMELFPIVLQTKDEFPTTVEERIENISECYVRSCPLHMQEEARTLYPRFIQDRQNVLQCLLKMYSNGEDIPADAPSRVKSILVTFIGDVRKNLGTNFNDDVATYKITKQIMEKEDIKSSLSKMIVYFSKTGL